MGNYLSTNFTSNLAAIHSIVHQWSSKIYQYIPVRYHQTISCLGIILCLSPCLVVFYRFRRCLKRRLCLQKDHQNDHRLSQTGFRASTYRIVTSHDNDDDDDNSSDGSEEKNYLFFTNKLKSVPNGDYIDVIHSQWYTDYDRLEQHHGFIQWLFPVRQRGVNAYAQPLQDHEIELIRQDEAAIERLFISYEMMLGFYGVELVSRQTGQVRRADNWQERFHNLNRNVHNNRRISRILSCIGLLGLHHLQLPLVKFFLNEIIMEKTLYNCRHSCFKYWMTTLVTDAYRDVNIYVQQLQKQSRLTAAAVAERNLEPDEWSNVEAASTTMFDLQKPQLTNTPNSQVDDTGKERGALSQEVVSVTETDTTNNQQKKLMSGEGSKGEDIHHDHHHHQQQQQLDEGRKSELTIKDTTEADEVSANEEHQTETINQEQSENTTLQQQEVKLG